ncbi:MAG TPA: methylmalonyl-CoA mutase family protein, partial [Bryobacteraceae bacterium]|nr:methylmalonyl-CoA mutase family protein [Bryobacteraceae bacterium]
NEYIRKIDEMGGMIPAIERGFPQTEIANASYEYQHAIETGDRLIVGVNAFTESNEAPLDTLQIGDAATKKQIAKLENLKRRRDRDRVAAALDRLKQAASGAENMMPRILDAVRAYATVGEICEALREVFGTYTESSVL